MSTVVIKTNEEYENKLNFLKGKLNEKTKSKVLIYCLNKVFEELTANDTVKMS